MIFRKTEQIYNKDVKTWKDRKGFHSVKIHKYIYWILFVPIISIEKIIHFEN